MGYTTDLQTRIKAHNVGQSPHTAKYKPWKLVGYHAFETIQQAKAFEAYLKSGSGRAFAKRHLWQ
ncbi:GIY-YIG nuclease family protein [Thalassobacterium sedimentorum]|uniref:GIY-YIG nuclease family protein n=1 Tax=Thalassobacterium sedimentorum TaxID=3041258 RepID=UPI0031F2F622